MTTPNSYPAGTPVPSQGEATATRETLPFAYTVAAVESAKDRPGGKLSEDAHIVNQDTHTFVVCDGAAGPYASFVASIAAESLVRRLAGPLDSPEAAEAAMSAALTGAREDLKAAKVNDPDEENRELEYDDGITTGVAVKLFATPDGNKYAVIGNAGDSGVCIRRADGTVERLTIEQCNPEKRNELTNYLSSERPIRGFDGQAIGQGTSEQTTDDVMTVELNEGDTLAIASDGVWGDQDDEKLRPAEISACLAAPTADDAAAQLHNTSRKKDDKSLIVIKIGELPEAGPRDKAVAAAAPLVGQAALGGGGL